MIADYVLLRNISNSQWFGCTAQILKHLFNFCQCEHPNQGRGQRLRTERYDKDMMLSKSSLKKVHKKTKKFSIFFAPNILIYYLDHRGKGGIYVWVIFVSVCHECDSFSIQPVHNNKQSPARFSKQISDPNSSPPSRVELELI